MPKKKRKIIVIGRLKAFDEEAWKRLLMAYAYYLHEQRTEHDKANAEEASGVAPAAEQTGGANA